MKRTKSQSTLRLANYAIEGILDRVYSNTDKTIFGYDVEMLKDCFIVIAGPKTYYFQALQALWFCVTTANPDESCKQDYDKLVADIRDYVEKRIPFDKRQEFWKNQARPTETAIA